MNLKHVFFICLILSFSFNANCQLDTILIHSIQMAFFSQTEGEGARVGYMDLDGNVVIEPKYTNGRDFINGIANIMVDSVCGIIDKNGNETLFPEFQKTYWFRHKWGLAKKDGKWGFIDKEGKIMIPLKYKKVGFFNEGYAAAYLDGKWNLIDENGKFLFDDEIKLDGNVLYNSMAIFQDSVVSGDKKVLKKGIIHKNGEVIVDAKYDHISQDFSRGYFEAANNYDMIYLNSDGEEFQPMSYEKWVYDRTDSGLTPVMKDKLWGYVNEAGEVVIPFEYEKTQVFHEGLAVVVKNGKMGFINMKNEVVIPFEYDFDWRARFSEGLSIFKKDKKFGFINTKGEEIIPPEYESALYFQNNGLAIVEKDGKKGLIDKKGNVIVLFEFVEIWNVSEGLARFAIEYNN